MRILLTTLLLMLPMSAKADQAIDMMYVVNAQNVGADADLWHFNLSIAHDDQVVELGRIHAKAVASGFDQLGTYGLVLNEIGGDLNAAHGHIWVTDANGNVKSRLDALYDDHLTQLFGQMYTFQTTNHSQGIEATSNQIVAHGNQLLDDHYQPASDLLMTTMSAMMMLEMSIDEWINGMAYLDGGYNINGFDEMGFDVNGFDEFGMTWEDYMYV